MSIENIVKEETIVGNNNFKLAIKTLKYKAEDGKTFDSLLEYNTYKKQLKEKKLKTLFVFKSEIKKIYELENEYNASLIYLRNKQDLIDYLEQQQEYIANELKENKIIIPYFYTDFFEKGPDWYICYCEPGGDYPDKYNVINYFNYINNIKKNIEEYHTNIENLIENKEKELHN